MINWLGKPLNIDMEFSKVILDSLGQELKNLTTLKKKYEIFQTWNVIWWLPLALKEYWLEVLFN